MACTRENWPILHLLEPEFISKMRMALVYGDSGNCCLIVTEDDMVYGLENNCETIDDQSADRATKIDELCGKKIKTFAYGRGHVLALSKNGEVYAWGENDYLQLGYSDDSSVPKKVQILLTEYDEANIVDIACGENHSIALGNDGLVYVWGNIGSYGHSSLDSTTNYNVSVQKVDLVSSTKCVGISCGGCHSMAVMNSGQMYGWGNNSSGQLGNGSTSNSLNPSQVKIPNGIVIEKVVCGKEHTLALTDKGSLYVWGNNKFGQLGIFLKGRISSSSTPLELASLKNVCDVAASHNRNISVAVVVGQIFVWGECLSQNCTGPQLVAVDSIHDAFALYTLPSVMHQPLVMSHADEDEDIEKEETIRVIDNLEAAFDDTNTSDFTIVVQRKTIYVHKAILRIRSEYFKKMFEGSWQENNDSVIKDGQFSYVVYRAFLKFLYTGKFDIPAENAVELLKLADFYNDDHLKTRCSNVIMRGVSTDNAVLIYSVAVQYNAMVLKERCIKFAVKCMTHIIESKSFAELSHEMMRSFITEVNKHKVFKT